jgi:hypothetical protein
MAAPHVGVGGRRTDGKLEGHGRRADMPKGAAVECPRRAIVAMVRVRLAERMALPHSPPIGGRSGATRGAGDWCENVRRRRINDEARQARRLLVHAATAAAHSPSSWPMVMVAEDGWKLARRWPCPLSTHIHSPSPDARRSSNFTLRSIIASHRRLALWLRRPAFFHILAPHALDDTERW